MKVYTSKKETTSKKVIVVDDMILTTDMPTTAGSKMLDGFMSLIESEALVRLKNAGYEVGGKANVGEFNFDVIGESSYFGAIVNDGKLESATAKIISDEEAIGALTLDVNGTIRRATAQSGLVSVKPTYGTVSRFGTIPVACSGETVSVLSKTTDTCREMLTAISGHDDKDGTSLSNELCAKINDYNKAKKVAVLTSMLSGIDGEVNKKIDETISILTKNGVEVEKIDNSIIPLSNIAWNVLMSAELCNNVSRYDGVKFGYRAENFLGIDELYTKSRTEAFGELLKTAIIFGSETLSTENYFKVYDKCLRTRRVIVEEFKKIFDSYDAVIMPATSTLTYLESAVKEDKTLCYKENFYTAPSSITGLPAVVVNGVQLVGEAFSDLKLLDLASVIEKEGK
ncbi:MAG: hypothetical protein IKA85_01115 [Clostridia bacterium]|nr:hypothetical protein [Clostridia bacterium]